MTIWHLESAAGSSLSDFVAPTGPSTWSASPMRSGK